MHLPARRLSAVALATAALALGGLTAGAGTAQAATTVNCATALSIEDNAFFGSFLAQGCNAFTPGGGPYTVTVSAYTAEVIFVSPPNVQVIYESFTNVNLTCQTFVALPSSVELYGASNCVANSYTSG
jgi:hypothetical protein